MLEIFSVDLHIDLVSIAMGDVFVIVCMDWLSRFGAVIDCERQMVTIREPSGGVLTMYDEGTRFGLAFCSSASARQSLQQGCMGYLACVMDTIVATEKPSSISNVPVACEFLDVFPNELPGVLPEK